MAFYGFLKCTSFKEGNGKLILVSQKEGKLETSKHVTKNHKFSCKIFFTPNEKIL